MGKRKKPRRWKYKPQPNVSREELAAMHEAVAQNAPRPGHEGYSLLCALAACLGNWPRVKKVKVAELREAFRNFQRGYGCRGPR